MIHIGLIRTSLYDASISCCYCSLHDAGQTMTENDGGLIANSVFPIPISSPQMLSLKMDLRK